MFLKQILACNFILVGARPLFLSKGHLEYQNVYGNIFNNNNNNNNTEDLKRAHIHPAG